jgi:hypothetical protein
MKRWSSRKCAIVGALGWLAFMACWSYVRVRLGWLPNPLAGVLVLFPVNLAFSWLITTGARRSTQKIHDEIARLKGERRAIEVKVARWRVMLYKYRIGRD